MKLDKLFSIDLDEKISKITRNRYTEDNFFIIELIRTALIRGAEKIEITVTGKKLTIKDNGNGIKDRGILFLSNIFNRELSILKRESVIESFLKKTGIGLLSIFTSPYNTIQLKNTQNSYEDELIFENSNCKYRREKGKFLAKTLIIINLVKEIKLNDIQKITQKYCSHLEESIYVNNSILPSKPLLDDCFVRLKLSSNSNQVMGTLGIPLRNNYCSIKLLHKNIPWDQKLFDPYNGLVFTAAVESKKESYEEIIHYLSEKVFELYKYVADKYSKYPPPIRERIEELIFNFVRKTGNEYFLDNFPVFKILDAKPVNSNYIKTISFKEPIFFIYEDQKKKLKTNLLLLVINKKQADFLINYLGLNLKPYQEDYKSGLFNLFKLIGFIRKIFLFLQKFLEGKITPLKTTTQQEEFFIKILQKYLEENKFYNLNPEILLIKNRFGNPILTTQDGNIKKIYIKRYNKIIKNLITAVNMNKENITIITPLLPTASKSGE
jgi:hypothetical protein